MGTTSSEDQVAHIVDARTVYNNAVNEVNDIGHKRVWFAALGSSAKNASLATARIHSSGCSICANFDGVEPT
jgi:hypothetical protein